ncbi:MAG: ABC transporter permease [Balneolaceae bacterium]|nr:ABC transporter permease [Balneolaceae bacterium]
MLKNYFKIAYRNLINSKLYSAINIIGLAVGISSCVLIGLYLNNEWTYDQFHEQSDRIYRAWVLEDYGENDRYFNTVTPLAVKPMLEQNIPEVASVTRYYQFADLIKAVDQETGYSQTMHMVDPSFFAIFDFTLTGGNPESLFKQPEEVVLTRSAANRYFGNSDPMGQTLMVRMGPQYEPFTVTGIIEEPPANSSVQFEVLIPFANSTKLFSERAHTSWYNVFAETYVLLDNEAKISQVKPKLASTMKQVLGEEEYSRSNYTVGLQPITDIHLNPEFPAGIAPVRDPAHLYILAAVALLILLIACVNFMTLAISRSASRAREIGIRKTVGAIRRHIAYQFLGEALLLTTGSLGLGILLSEQFLPLFNNISGTELELQINSFSLLLFAGLTLFISLIAGSYPAFYLSRFKPAEVLRGRLAMKGDRSRFRQGMVVFQFALSIFLIAGTLIVNRQLDFVRSKDLGYQKEHTVILQADATLMPGMRLQTLLDEIIRKKDLLIDELSGEPSIRKVSASIFTPAQNGWINVDFRDQDDRKYTMNINFVDADYLKTMDIGLVLGRSFSAENPSDARRAVVVNQALVDAFELENPVGGRLPGNFDDHVIIGVSENFNYESLHTRVEPLALSINPRILTSGINNIGIQSSPAPRITAVIAPGDLPKAMDQLESAWKEVAPQQPFNYTFLDQVVDSQYRREERLSTIASIGSTLAIIIACMGLFGLASLIVVQRTKEIGIRKVLGAGAGHIILLVNREFTWLVVIAFVIAAPAAWYGAVNWLEDFAYKTDIGAGVFLIAGLLTLLVAWLSVSYQSVRAAMMDPVKSLRSE